MLEIEKGFELGRRQRLGDFGIFGQDLLEIAALLPAFHGVALNRVVSLKTTHALIDELEKHRRGEDQPLGAVKIFLHALGIDVEPIENAADAVKHEIEQDR